MTDRKTAKQILDELTLEEKITLLSGRDWWHIGGLKSVGLKQIMTSDGPHGLRTIVDTNSPDTGRSPIKATCFPTACATACSFDRDLLLQMGKALGEEARAIDVDVLLGPGINIKRSPLCGRNFEYFSEDPYLAGQLAVSYINGVQSTGVAACLKHFALNDQETNRFTVTSVCDERAKREIYLSAFEMAIKGSSPYTVMSSYNRVDGTFASDSKVLLTKILRKEWGFDGTVLSDWGGVNDRVRALKAGCDVEMPGPDSYSMHQIEDALKAGKLKESVINRSALRVIRLILKCTEREKTPYSRNAHEELARKIASQCIVLLKNENKLLPIDKKKSIALIGDMAKKPYFQAGGSSRVNASNIQNAHDELMYLGVDFEYARGYSLEGDADEDDLINEACTLARGKDTVILFAGLNEKEQSEGYDRNDLLLPKAQLELIRRLKRINDNVIVVLSGGGVIDMSWQEDIPAILMCHLAGQACGGAIADILTGRAVPSGKLAETWPLKLEDHPSYKYFPGYDKSVEYRESIFVGYRYFDTADKPVAYPFGHGLSYTTFDYSNISLDKDIPNDRIVVTADITNTGDYDAAEVVQLYVAPPKSRIFRASHELKGFEKVFLKKGETKKVSFTLDARSFAFYNTERVSWQVESGEYTIQLGSSSRDIRLKTAVAIDGDRAAVPSFKQDCPCYYDLRNGMDVPEEQFTALYGKKLPARVRDKRKKFDMNATLADLKDTAAGRIVAKQIVKEAAAKRVGVDEELVEASMKPMTLRFISLGLPGASRDKSRALVEMANGKLLEGIDYLKRKE